MIEGAIFDFDGTLFDSMFVWDTIGEEYLRSIGYCPRENLNKTIKAMSLYQAACYYRSEYGVLLSTDDIISGVNQMIEHYYTEIIQPKPGIIDLLRKLRDVGCRLCIATATDRYLIQAALTRCKMDCFSEIFTCASVGSGKDEPAIFREALSHLGTDKQKTLVFEDAAYAVNTAKQDGFTVVGVYDKYEESHEEVERIADFYLQDYTGLSDFWDFASLL